MGGLNECEKKMGKGGKQKYKHFIICVCACVCVRGTVSICV